jgi:hypothetical protein
MKSVSELLHFVELARPPDNEPLPLFLRDMTLKLLRRYGCHPESGIDDLENRGLVPSDSRSVLAAIPRWDKSGLRKLGTWAWCDQSLPTLNPTNTLGYHLHRLNKAET